MKLVIFEDNIKFKESLELVVLSSNIELCGSFKDTTRLEQRIEALQPDIVLMDINISPLNGIEATATIKEKFADIKICIQTVFDDDDKVFASLCAGASGYILKSASGDKILQAIKEVGDGGVFFTPTIAKKVLNNFQQNNNSTSEFIQLSEKEKQVLKELVNGLSYKMIAANLYLSYHTIHTHIRNIYEKLHVNSKGEAVAKALRNKLV